MSVKDLIRFVAAFLCVCMFAMFCSCSLNGNSVITDEDSSGLSETICINDVCENEGTYYCVGTRNTAFKISPDGKKSALPLSSEVDYNCVCANENGIIIAGNAGVVFFSKDYKNYKRLKSPRADINFTCAAAVPSGYVIGSESGELTILNKSDLEASEKLTLLECGTEEKTAGISWFDNHLVAISVNGLVAVSQDLESFEVYNTETTQGVPVKAKNMSSDKNGFLVTANLNLPDDKSPVVMTSKDGKLWTFNSVDDKEFEASDTVFDGNNYFIGSTEGRILSTNTLFNGTKTTTAVEFDIKSLVCVKGQLLAAGENGKYAFLNTSDLAY